MGIIRAYIEGCINRWYFSWITLVQSFHLFWVHCLGSFLVASYPKGYTTEKLTVQTRRHEWHSFFNWGKINSGTERGLKFNAFGPGDKVWKDHLYYLWLHCVPMPSLSTNSAFSVPVWIGRLELSLSRRHSRWRVSRANSTHLLHHKHTGTRAPAGAGSSVSWWTASVFLSQSRCSAKWDHDGYHKLKVALELISLEVMPP